MNNGFSVINNSYVIILGYRHFSMISRVFMLLGFLSILLQLARETSKGYAND